MNFKLKVWRQKDGASPGSFKDYDAKDIPSEASFLEMLDIVNEILVEGGEDPIAFDSDSVLALRKGTTRSGYHAFSAPDTADSLLRF